MKNVLVIGSTGQIGSELTMKIRKMCPEGNVVAGYIKGAEPKGILLESGPAAEADVCNGEQLLGIVKKYNMTRSTIWQPCSPPWRRRSRNWHGTSRLTVS